MFLEEIAHMSFKVATTNQNCKPIAPFGVV
jgi:hypothetical protein